VKDTTMKMLIAEACQIAGEETSFHADVGAEVDVPKDEASSLARMGRAFYLSKEDDPTKGTLTATAEDKKNIKLKAEALAAELVSRTEAAQAQSPAGMAAMVAAQVAAAVQAALKSGAGKPAA
jgi:hypothetical protein